MTEADFEKLIEHKYRKINRSGEDTFMEEIDNAIAMFDMSKKLLNEHVSDDLVVSDTISKSAAYEKGKQYELMIADLIRSHPTSLSQGLSVDQPITSGHGADVTIRTPAGAVEIEVKHTKKGTTSGLDFGQFKLEYNINTKKWSIGGKHRDDEDGIAAQLFKKYLEAHLFSRADQVADIINKYGTDDNKILAGFKEIKGKSEILNSFMQAIFGEEKELLFKVDNSEVANYYDKYDFIQIGTRGLFSLKNEVSMGDLSIPLFASAINKAGLRFRIKYHGGKTEMKWYSFTFAIKLDISKSTADLEKSTDLDKFVAHMSAHRLFVNKNDVLAKTNAHKEKRNKDKKVSI